MDMFVNTPGPAADTFDIPLDLIDDSPTDGRSVRPTPAADRAMAISLEITGQLQNIGVNPPNAAGHYPMAFGARRLRAARLNGWTTIRALVKNWSTAEVAAIRAAENMQRVALDPIDQWLAVQELMDGGASLAAAAQGASEGQSGMIRERCRSSRMRCFKSAGGRISRKRARWVPP